MFSQWIFAYKEIYSTVFLVYLVFFSLLSIFESYLLFFLKFMDLIKVFL